VKNFFLNEAGQTTSLLRGLHRSALLHYPEENNGKFLIKGYSLMGNQETACR